MHRRVRYGFLAVTFCAMLGGFGCIDTDDEPITRLIAPRHDHRAPEISEIQVVHNRPGTEIGWKTDEFSDSALYLSPGSPPPAGSISATKYFPEPLLQHWISLSGLTPGTTYYYYVISRDYGHNTVISDVRTFDAPTYPPRQSD